MGRWWLLKPRWWTFGIGIRLHHIMESDNDRHLHDHPWWWISFILDGSYREYSLEYRQGVVFKAGSIRFNPRCRWHRLELLSNSGVWSIFVTGPYTQTWGFLVNGQKINHREYLASEKV